MDLHQFLLRQVLGDVILVLESSYLTLLQGCDLDVGAWVVMMLSLAVVFCFLEFSVKFLDLFEDLFFVNGGQLMVITLVNHVITSVTE